MTRLKTLRLFLIATFIFFTADFAKTQINAGGGLVYGTEIESLGFNLRGGYLIKEKFNLSAGYTYFVPREDNITQIKTEMWTVNVDGSYWFDITDNFFLYPLVGLNITNYTLEPTYDVGMGSLFGDGETETRLGLNLGGGLGYKLGNVVPFLEGKYVVSDFDQTVATAGVLIMIN